MAANKDIVHILLQGHPLCGFSTTYPGNWPLGNLWVGLAQFNESPDIVNCNECNRLGRIKLKLDQVKEKHREGDEGSDQKRAAGTR